VRWKREWGGEYSKQWGFTYSTSLMNPVESKRGGEIGKGDEYKGECVTDCEQNVILKTDCVPFLN